MCMFWKKIEMWKEAEVLSENSLLTECVINQFSLVYNGVYISKN